MEEHGGNVCVFCRERDYELLELWKSMVVMFVCFVENETTSYWSCGRVTGVVEEHGGNVCVFCRERDYELLELWKSMVVMFVCFVENETTSYWSCGRAWW